MDLDKSLSGNKQSLISAYFSEWPTIPESFELMGLSRPSDTEYEFQLESDQFSIYFGLVSAEWRGVIAQNEEELIYKFESKKELIGWIKEVYLLAKLSNVTLFSDPSSIDVRGIIQSHSVIVDWDWPQGWYFIPDEDLFIRDCRSLSVNNPQNIGDLMLVAESTRSGEVLYVFERAVIEMLWESEELINYTAYGLPSPDVAFRTIVALNHGDKWYTIEYLTEDTEWRAEVIAKVL